MNRELYDRWRDGHTRSDVSLDLMVEDGDDCSGMDFNNAWAGDVRTVYNVNFSGASFREASLGCVFQDCNFTGVDFTGVVLNNCEFRDCVLDGAIGIATYEEEIALLERIADAVLNDPISLDMGTWHSKPTRGCGAAHCMAGWAQFLKTGKENFGTVETDGSRLLPRHAYLFFRGDGEALRVLREVYRGPKPWLRVEPVMNWRKGTPRPYGHDYELDMAATLERFNEQHGPGGWPPSVLDKAKVYWREFAEARYRRSYVSETPLLLAELPSDLVVNDEG